MQLTKLHTTLFVTLCAALAACSADDAFVDATHNGKTPIELSIGGVDAPSLTRAVAPVITTNPYNPLNYFDQTNATKVFMIMKSTYGQDDYEGSHDTKYTVARGDVAANSNKVTFDTNNQRYWDDAHARSSQLNFWAYAQIGMGWTTCTFEEDNGSGGYKGYTVNTNTSQNWRTAPIYPFIQTWKASRYDDDHQDASSVMCQDLIFSNNLVDNSATGTNLGGSDNALKFNFTTRKFPQEGEAQMKFYRAMSKITIKIIEGDGFDKTSANKDKDFQFPSGKNVKLTGFNTEGLFSIQKGFFQQINASAAIPSIYLKSTTPTGSEYYTLEALAVPNIDDFMQTWSPAQHDVNSRFVMDDAKVMMEFTIDGNTYKITSATLYSALLKGDGTPVDNATKKTNNGTYIPMEAGKNYVFTFTVGKTKINDITANVAEWETVTANNINPKNGISLTLNMEHTTGTQTPLASRLFRSAVNSESTADNDKGYSNSEYKDLSAVTTQQSTDWYWPSNNTYYHFRTIAPQNNLTKDGTTEANYLTMTGGAVASTSDYAWGAPLEEKHSGDNHAIPYDMTKGYEGYLFHAIGPTDNNIHITQFHMMSDLEINLSTTANDSPDHVDLTSATVTLKKYYNTGNLMVGTGLISGRGALTNNQNLTPETAGSKYSWRVIPQNLSRTGTDAGTVGLCITTADGNIYDIPDLSTLKVTINSQADQTIPTWLPGKKYVYNLTLKKTKIENITATIVQWETITAGDDNVQIK